MADIESITAENTRDKTIIRTSVIGILANVLLAAFKAAVGILVHSIAITLDAVNNVTDAGSSLITIIGTKLAGKQADKKHPFGYGRVEYLSAMVISLLVLYAGVTSLTESIKKILRPEAPDYTAAALIIVGVGVLVKLLLGRFVKRTGEKVRSDSLVNSGKDALLDAIISASTLVAAAVYLLWQVSLEAWLGALISLLIIKSGLEMLRDTLSQILGERADASLAREIKETVTAFPEVYGAYDLVLNNYGPDTFNGSVHIEVPDTCTAETLDELLRAITMTVYEKHHVILTAIGVYSRNTQNESVNALREAVRGQVMAHEYVREMHAFYVSEEKKTMRFDLVVSLDAKDRQALWREIYEEICASYPDYTVQVLMDTDFSEE